MNLDTTVKEYFRIPERAHYKGTFGVELELEGTFVPRLNLLGWRCEEDGSLRKSNAEYVFSKPCTFNGTGIKVRRLFKALEENQAVISDSKRAGSHLHVNMQDFTLKQMWTFYTLCLLFENGLVEYCGKERVGNLFCLRTADCQRVLERVKAALNRGSLMNLKTDAIRYSAINLKSLFSYGSIEFRCMKTTTDIDYFMYWVGAIEAIRLSVSKFSDPKDVVSQFSLHGWEGMCKMILPDHERITNLISEDDAREAMWRAQEVAYAGDWHQTEENLGSVQWVDKKDLFNDKQRAEFKKVMNPTPPPPMPHPENVKINGRAPKFVVIDDRAEENKPKKKEEWFFDEDDVDDDF